MQRTARSRVRALVQARAVALSGVLVAALAASACDDMLVAGALPEAGNVDALVGAAVVATDTGVVVDGHTVVRYPTSGRAMWLDRFERFDFGGFPELDYPQDARHSLAWRLMLTHEQLEERGDSTIFRFHDHGDVTVAGVTMDKATDLPHVGPSAPPVRFENFIRYLLSTRVTVEWLHGGSTEVVRESFHGDLVAGRDLTIQTTGSASVLPTHATFAVGPFALLRGLENDGPISLDRTSVPSVDANQPLVFTFDRSFDPAHGFIILHPMARDRQPGTRAAFIQTRSATQRVVIPPHVLRQLVAEADGAEAAFRAIIMETRVQPDVFVGQLTEEAGGDEFSLPFVRRGETSVHLYLRR